MLEAVNRKLEHLQAEADQMFMDRFLPFLPPPSRPQHCIRREQLLNFANHSAELLIRRRATDRATGNAGVFSIKDGG